LYITLACLLALPAAALDGSVKDTAGQPIQYAFVSLLGEDYSFLGYAITDKQGVFAIDAAAPKGRLVVQPPGNENSSDYGVYSHMPRIFELGNAARADVQLPAAGCLILLGYDATGTLLRWEDYEKRGRFGSQFMYYTDLGDRMQEASCWPVHDAVSRGLDSPREQGRKCFIGRRRATGSFCCAPTTKAKGSPLARPVQRASSSSTSNSRARPSTI
jgi:hypothetical protein